MVLHSHRRGWTTGASRASGPCRDWGPQGGEGAGSAPASRGGVHRWPRSVEGAHRRPSTFTPGDGNGAGSARSFAAQIDGHGWAWVTDAGLRGAQLMSTPLTPLPVRPTAATPTARPDQTAT